MKKAILLHLKPQKISINQKNPLISINSENIYYFQNNAIITTNNNDTFNFILNVISLINQSLLYFYNYLLLSLVKITSYLYKFQFLLLIFTLFSTFVYSYNKNSSEVPTSLIINAYFSSGNKITHVKNNNTDDIISKTNDDKNQNTCPSQSSKTDENKCSCCQCCDKNSKNKQNDGDENDQNDLIYDNQKDWFLFFIIPIKSSVFSFICFLLLYLYIKLTYSLKISGSLIFNLFFIFIIYNLELSLYELKYYFASNFLFILLIYLFKCSIDSIYLKFKFQRMDFEIFSTDLIAVNTQQFLLKFIELSLITIISGFLSIFIFKLILNYIVFYLCLLTLIFFICNVLETISPYFLKPMRNVIIFFIGVYNFFLFRIILCLYKKNKENVLDTKVYENYMLGSVKNDNKNNKYYLYFVSDLFSLFCFDYLREYFDWQIEEYLFSTNINSKISMNKCLLWGIFFIIPIFVVVVSGIKNEYICFILGVYLSKIIMSYFINVFNPKIFKILNHFIIIIYLFILLKISNNDDIYLYGLFELSKISKKFILYTANTVCLLLFSYYILVNDKNLYYTINFIYETYLISSKHKNLPQQHIKKILALSKKLRNLNFQLTHGKPNIISQYKINNFIYLTSDLYLNFLEICIMMLIIRDYERKLIPKLLYMFLIFLLNIPKFFIIHSIKNDIEYLFVVIISFLFTSRLLFLSLNTSTVIYCINHINLLVFIIFYSIAKNKKKLITIILIFHSYFSLVVIKSNFLLLDLTILIAPSLVDLFKNLKKMGIKKLINQISGFSVIICSLFLLIFSLFKNLGSNKCEKIMQYIKIILGKNNEVFFCNKKNEINEPFEYRIIHKIFNISQSFGAIKN